MDTLLSLTKRNEVLNFNPPAGDIHITGPGDDWLWTVFSVDYFVLVILLVWMFWTPRRDRVFHYLSTLTVVVTGFCYLAIAGDIADLAVPPEFTRHQADVRGTARQVFWIRYVDWFFTMPFIVINLNLTSGLYWHNILYNIILVIVFTAMYLVGVIVPNSYRWGFYTIGTVALLLSFEVNLFQGISAARAVGGNVAKFYPLLAGYLCIIQLLYPICWACSEGGNVISPTSEQVFYGILDLLTKPFFAIILLLVHTQIDKADLDLHLWDRMDPERWSGRREKPYHEKDVERAADAPAAAATGSEPAHQV